MMETETYSISAWNELTHYILGDLQAERLNEIICLLADDKLEQLPINLIFEGKAGTGKSTLLDLIYRMFPEKFVFSSMEFALHSPVKLIDNRVHLIHDFDYRSFIKKSLDENGIFKSPFIFGATNRPIDDALIPYCSAYMETTGFRFPKEKYFKLVSTIVDDLPAVKDYCKIFYRKPSRYAGKGGWE